MKTLIRFVIVMLSLPMFAQTRGLKIYISADVEGIGGVVTDQQLGPTGFEYAKARASGFAKQCCARCSKWRAFSPSRRITSRASSRNACRS